LIRRFSIPEGLSDTSDDLDGSAKLPTPRDVAEAARIATANKIAKGRAIADSGKYKYLVN